MRCSRHSSSYSCTCRMQHSSWHQTLQYSTCMQCTTCTTRLNQDRAAQYSTARHSTLKTSKTCPTLSLTALCKVVIALRRSPVETWPNTERDSSDNSTPSAVDEAQMSLTCLCHCALCYVDSPLHHTDVHFWYKGIFTLLTQAICC